VSLLRVPPDAALVTLAGWVGAAVVLGAPVAVVGLLILRAVPLALASLLGPMVLGVALVGLALLVSLPAAGAVAVAVDQALPRGPLRRALSTTVELLEGLPPVVHGLLGLIVLAPLLGTGSSPFLALLVLSGVALAPLSRALREALEGALVEERLAAAALGATPLQVLLHVVGPAVRGPLLAATLRVAGRLLGLAAPLLLVLAPGEGVLASEAVHLALAGDIGAAAAATLVLVGLAVGLHALAWPLDRPASWGVRW
jgi:ABC-type phosphate transport system permease subunit